MAQRNLTYSKSESEQHIVSDMVWGRGLRLHALQNGFLLLCMT